MTPAPFPAILIGGPPHSGKSVLAYNLTQKLRSTVSHYVIRAAPDGEGDFSYETPQHVVQALRHKGRFTEHWVARTCRDIAQRQTQLIVEMGGLPTRAQWSIFNQAPFQVILLTREATSHAVWNTLVRDHHLTILADLTSIKDGEGELFAREPWLAGTQGGLERGKTVTGKVFEALLERVEQALSWTSEEIEQRHLASQPFDDQLMLINSNALMHTWHPGGPYRFTEHDYARAAALAPVGSPVAVYGRTPAAMIGAIAAAHPITWLFDIRTGWMQPPPVRLADDGESADGHGVIDFTISARAPGLTRVEFTLTESYLDAEACVDMVLPRVQEGNTVELFGKMPLWIFASAVRAYTGAGHKTQVYETRTGDLQS
jgi:CRISPR-associated protein Csx3